MEDLLGLGLRLALDVTTSRKVEEPSASLGKMSPLSSKRVSVLPAVSANLTG